MEAVPLAVETDFDVRYAETDAMGIVHHSAYIVWFEEGRSAWFRERLADHRGYALMEDEGYFFAVTGVSARYVAAARYGDRIRVRTWISAVRSRGMTVSYRVSNVATGQLLCKGQTTHVCLDQHGHVVAIPVHWAAKLLS
ncbi:MAG: acyl-CoA thioesterase [Anaerolineae bacterium]|nr:acyl-CoA thioesterase [Anaerolineae bacterium]